MGRLEVPQVEPIDTYGVPEFKITTATGEIIGNGHDVRLIFGDTPFGQLKWLYSVISDPEDMLKFCAYAEALAMQAIRLRQARSEPLVLAS